MSDIEDRESPSRHVMRLLLENRIVEAQEYVDKGIGDQITRLEHEAMRLRREQQILGQLTRIHMRREQQPLGDEPLPTVPLQSADNLLDLSEPIEDVRHAIFSTCIELAQRSGGNLFLSDAVDEVKKRGIDLKSSRPGTSIGNMLFKSADWSRMGDGLFRWNHYKE